ncbi:hypothetical protein EJB05_48899, partial [Eragrostis curvula]
MDVKYSKPALFQHGGTVAPTKKLEPVPAWGRATAIEPPAGVYLECLRNHAASVGGYVVDGCGEFTPAADPADDPASLLRCAACRCHRSFHRRALAEGPPPRLALPPPPQPPAVTAAAALHHHLVRDVLPSEVMKQEDRAPGAGEGAEDDDWGEETDEGSDYDNRPMSPLPAPAAAPAPPPPGCFGIASASQMLLYAMSKGAAATPAPGASPPLVATARKRARTRFSAEQKERMRALSERVGWRLQKRDEAAVEGCCREIGVTRGVFKVWMHNNKHNFVAGGHSARRNAAAASASPVPAAAAGVVHPAASSSHHAAAPPPPAAAASAPPATRVHVDFNINGAASDYFVVQSTTASGGSSQ